MNIAVCIGCGCDDHHACLDPKSHEPCSWLEVDYGLGKGVCSCCSDHLQRWNSGDREVQVRIPTVQEILDAPDASFWLKNALREAIKRDPVDAVTDAELLVLLLQRRVEDALTKLREDIDAGRKKR